MRDLESLILGLDAVEAFAIIHEQRSKYVESQMRISTSTNRYRTKRRRDSGTLKVMGQELEECVGVLEDWIAAVTDEDWLLKSPDRK